MTCKNCNGTGRCPKCRGTGVRNYRGFGLPNDGKCLYCNGSGVCRSCKGKQ